MDTPNIWTDYIKATADNFPPKGFLTVAIDDLEDLLDGKFKVAVNKTGFNLRLIEPMFDNFTNEANGLNCDMLTGFSCLHYLPAARLSATKVRELQNESYSVLRKFIARLVAESRTGISPAAYSLNQLEQGNFRKDKLSFEKEADFFVGYLITFRIKFEYIENINATVAATGWLDL